MPDSIQEQRCIAAVVDLLRAEFGGQWEILDRPDEHSHLVPKPKTPEEVHGNGSTTAAIEVKRLTGGRLWQGYVRRHNSLFKSLAPKCGGSYYLMPCFGLGMDMTPGLRTHVRKEIERVARNMAVDQSKAIRVYRSGVVRSLGMSPRRDGFINCACATDAGVVSEVSAELRGIYYLNDWPSGQPHWGHSFVTTAARKAFQDALVKQCTSLPDEASAPLSWTEEWELTRIEGEGRSGVVVLGGQTGNVLQATDEDLSSSLASALQKFQARRWAAIHILAVEPLDMSYADLASVRDSLRRLSVPECLDRIALVKGATASWVWPFDLGLSRA